MVLLLQPLPEGLLPAAVELDRQVFGGFWSFDAYRTELNRTSSTLVGIWPASTAQAPALLAVGCSWVIEDEAHIILMAVDPVYRQRCLGTALLLGLLMDAQRRGCHYATLEVNAANNAAIALYQKFQFAVAGRRKNYYPDTGEDALVMWRSGLQSAEFLQQAQSHQAQICLHWPEGLNIEF